GVVRLHAAQLDEDLVDLLRVPGGVDQRLGVAPALVVAGDQRQAAELLRGGRLGEDQRGEEEEGSHGFCTIRVNCSPGSGSGAMRDSCPPAARYAWRAASAAAETCSGSSERMTITRSAPDPVNSRLSGR